MKKYSHLIGLVLLSFIIVSMSSCGYKPSAKYAREVLGNSISTSIVVSQTDPENSVIIKDAVDQAVIEVFHSALVDKKHSTTHLTLSMSNPSYSALQYDNNGFIISYRAKISLSIIRKSKNTTKNYVASGTYDFSVVPNSVLTEQERFDAIKFSSFKAISAFVAQVSAEGSRIK